MTFMEAWAAFGPMIRVIGSVFRIRIVLSRVVSEAGSARAVRLDSAGEKPLAGEVLLVVEKPSVAERLHVAEKLHVAERLHAAEKPRAEERRDDRSLQPSAAAAVIAPLAEFRTGAPRGCKAITDSPA
jgi:hypothetical protein